MMKAKLALAAVLLAAANIVFAEQPAKPLEKASPKDERPATAAGGQSSGASTAETSGGTGFGVEAIVGVVAWVAAGAVAANVKRTESATSH